MKRRLLTAWRRPSRSGPMPFVREFTVKEIKRATDGFSVILGSGSHGTVYRARFSDGHVAAVRKVESSHQGSITFYREVELLGRLHHRHLVRLQGFSGGHDRFLVFDDMENGSLKDYLHDHIEERSRNMIFEFGMLILELITGQSLCSDDEGLAQWAQESRFTCSMHKMVDGDLGYNYDSAELKSLLIIARLCTRSRDEPTISFQQILHYLRAKVDSSVS